MYGDGDDDDDEGEYDDTDGEGEEEETDEEMDDDDDDDDEAWASLKNPADMEVEGGGGRPRPPASRVSVIDALDPDGAADAKAEAMKDAGNAEYKQGKAAPPPTITRRRSRWRPRTRRTGPTARRRG